MEMPDYAAEVARLQAMLEEIQRVRTRVCEPKSNANPRYLALSNAVTNLRKAIADLRADG
jgi:hypothetical protein